MSHDLCLGLLATPHGFSRCRVGCSRNTTVGRLNCGPWTSRLLVWAPSPILMAFLPQPEDDPHPGQETHVCWPGAQVQLSDW